LVLNGAKCAWVAALVATSIVRGEPAEAQAPQGEAQAQPLDARAAPIVASGPPDSTFYVLTRAELDAPPRADGQDHLRGHWRAKLGDDPSWASPDFDDRTWEAIDPGSNLSRLRTPAMDEERAGRHGIYWFRLHVWVDSALAGPTYLAISNLGPVEIYLNGEVVHAFGDPTAPAARRSAGIPATPTPIAPPTGFIEVVLPPGEAVIALRYNVAAQFAESVQFTLGDYVILKSEPGVRANRIFYDGVMLWAGAAVGVLLALGFIHLLLFAALRAHRTHAYFAGFALTLGAGIAAVYFQGSVETLQDIDLYIDFGFVNIELALVLFCVFLYRTFEMRTPKAFVVIVAAMALAASVHRLDLINWSSDRVVGAAELTGTVALSLVTLEAMRVLLLAIYRRVEGARILACGFVVLMAVMIAILVPPVFTGQPFPVPFWAMALAWVSVPLSSSIYLARQTARTTHRLERLSAHLEEEVQQRTAQLELARVAADAANETKSQFLANMSHELRTPLNAIIGYSEMLSEEAQDSGHDAYLPDLEKIHGSGKHLLGLINDILDLSKIEAGKMELFVESVDVARMLAEVASTVKPLVERNANRIELDAASDLGAMRTDQVKLRQILLNLLSNASKFTDKGVITLAARAENGPGGQHLVFSVRDTGIGMTAEQVARLFQPFVQAEASTTRKYGGTGLGLAISKHLTEMLGGRITVESKVGEGTTFTARIPVVVPGIAATDAASSGPEAASDAASQIAQSDLFTKATVLVIDDESAAREMLSRMLAKEGYRVLAAASGPDGIALAAQALPDVITLDIMMSGMDGWTVLSQLKANPLTAAIPVVVITIVDDRNLSFALGAAEYLPKPVDREQLAQVLGRVRGGGGPHTVLLVEDDPSARAMMRRLCEKEGWTVAEAENGRLGLEAMKVHAPGLILLDLMMPEMDGFQFLERLRTGPDRSTTPVVVLTAKDLSDGDRARLRGSVTQVLQKGGETQSVLQEIRGVLEANRIST
jgi:signal transduction histidine kinase/DNA-binding response OmpR family regulator